ncbi:MAG: hypothetical protein IPM01_30975 [Burkholderiaceae bacterium]|nr:hypothetical protein [Burkholderiaceae bacterium]
MPGDTTRKNREKLADDVGSATAKDHTEADADHDVGKQDRTMAVRYMSILAQACLAKIVVVAWG